MSKCHVFLVPGFFGFNTLGTFDYFLGVDVTLRAALARRGIQAIIHSCETKPTAFVKYRARHLAEQVTSECDHRSDEIHFIGHSTGGLDLRQLLSPTKALGDSRIFEAIRAQTKSAIFLATPHRGTSLAQFFEYIRGRQTLKLLASGASAQGKLAIFAAAKLLHAIATADDFLGQNKNTLDMLSHHLLKHLTLDENDPLWRFLRNIAADQGSMILLTTEWMDHFNSTVIDNPSIHYSCVVTAAPPPLAHGLFTLLKRKPHTLNIGFALLHTAVARTPTAPSKTLPSENHIELIKSFYQSKNIKINANANDGIVPTLSQPYGKLLTCVVADHLDIVGQFRRHGSAPYSDWLPSGSSFDEISFGKLWDKIADEIARQSNLSNGSN